MSGQRLEPDRALLECRMIEPNDWCHRCGCQSVPRGHTVVVRRRAHLPLG